MIIARFMPILCAFSPVLAGAAGMSQVRFALRGRAPGVSRSRRTVFTVHFLGRYIPGIDDHLEKLIIVD